MLRLKDGNGNTIELDLDEARDLLAIINAPGTTNKVKRAVITVRYNVSREYLDEVLPLDAPGNY